MEYNSVEYKRLLVDLMSRFHHYCIAHNLKYTLCGGSLLGAVRHEGIIPWDDDVDVIMPRPDYMSLIELYKNEPVDGYRIINVNNTPNYYLPYSKFINDSTTIIEQRRTRKCPIGVYIDIFPIDGIPIDEDEASILYKRFNNMKKKAMLSSLSYSLSNEENLPILGLLKTYLKNKLYRCLFNSRNLFLECDRIASSTNYDSSERVRIYTSVQFSSKIFDKKIFEEFTDMKFEGLVVKGIKNYDVYLRALYGDYMKLPPEEKRVSHHSQYYVNLSDNILKIE